MPKLFASASASPPVTEIVLSTLRMRDVATKPKIEGQNDLRPADNYHLAQLHFHNRNYLLINWNSRPLLLLPLPRQSMSIGI